MKPEPTLRILESTDRGIVTLAMTGELDEASCPALADCLTGHCRPGVRIVLDLRALNFVDAAGLALIQDAYVRASLEHWTLAVMTPGERFVSRRAVA